MIFDEDCVNMYCKSDMSRLVLFHIVVCSVKIKKSSSVCSVCSSVCVVVCVFMKEYNP